MRKILFFLLLSVCTFRVCAQDSLKYDYAMLMINVSDEEVAINYSNGTRIDLFAKFNLSKKDDRYQTIFRCIKYLNDQGYELQSSGLYLKYAYFSGSVPQYNNSEYLFKKKSK